MSLILSIETSTSLGSIALHRDGRLVGLFDINLENSHSRTLTLQIEQVMALTGYGLSQLDAIALSGGPGSYTGLRIGTATAKGLCFAADKPLIAIGTLEAMHYGASSNKAWPRAWLCPMLDARRMEAWCALYSVDNQEVWKAAPRILAANSFEEIPAKETIILFGNAAGKYQEVFRESSHHFIFADDFAPSAKYVGDLACQYFKEGKMADVAYFEPYYLKEGNAGSK